MNIIVELRRIINPVILFLLFSSNLLAYSPEVNDCYLMDGPANIRDSANGNKIDTLPSGQSVLILESKENTWYKIGYSKQNQDAESQTCGGDTIGWTYKLNLTPRPEPIRKLIKENKVQLIYDANNRFVETVMSPFNYEEETVEVFGETLKFRPSSSIPGDELDLRKPLIISQYCSNGEFLINEITRITHFGSWVSYELKKSLPSSYCLSVNGALFTGIKNKLDSGPEVSHCDEVHKNYIFNSIEDYKTRYPDASDHKEYEEYIRNSAACSYLDLPFSIDGKNVVISREDINRVPSNHKWKLWLLTNELVEDFNIGRLSLP